LRSDAQVKQTAKIQSPTPPLSAARFSRSTELVFDQRIGDVFCARVAGIRPYDIIGLEYSQGLGRRALSSVDIPAVRSSAVDDVKLGISRRYSEISGRRSYLEQAMVTGFR